MKIRSPIVVSKNDVKKVTKTTVKSASWLGRKALYSACLGVATLAFATDKARDYIKKTKE